MKNSILILTAVVFFAVSCNKVENCKEEKYTAAVVQDFPDSLKVGVTYDLKIDYILENSCGAFEDFEVQQIDDYTQVKLKTVYEGCNCTLEFSEAAAFFPISFTTGGTYKFKFWLSDSDYDSYALTVYE